MNVHIRCFGCTANFGEATDNRRTLEKAGHEIVNDIERADAVLLRTCCVIERTELNMYKELDDLTRSGRPVIVTGCMAVARREELEKRFPGILLAGFDEEDGLPEMLEELNAIRGKSDGPGEECGGPLDTLIRSNIVSPDSDRLSTTHIRVISNGCAGNCSYCVTKIARGGLRSFPSSQIIEGVSAALANGKKEVYITSQDNAVYGVDRGDERLLPDLLRGILEDNAERHFRIRVGMMNPWGAERIVEDLIPVLKDERIYSFLHLPVQSGDDEILEAMGRRYKAADIRKLVGKFRRAIPDLTLSTDVIAGFPGESAEQFRRTVELVEEIRPEVMNITRFSPRPGTRAARMEPKVPGWKAKERSRKFTRMHGKMTRKNLGRYVGRTLTALSSETGKNASTVLRTDNYLPVVVKEELALGEIVEVEIVDMKYTYLIGKPTRRLRTPKPT